MYLVGVYVPRRYTSTSYVGIDVPCRYAVPNPTSLEYYVNNLKIRSFMYVFFFPFDRQ
jgi:hypothetical protein